MVYFGDPIWRGDTTFWPNPAIDTIYPTQLYYTVDRSSEILSKLELIFSKLETITAKIEKIELQLKQRENKSDSEYSNVLCQLLRERDKNEEKILEALGLPKDFFNKEGKKTDKRKKKHESTVGTEQGP